MTTTTMTTKGQVTLPKWVLEVLQLAPGARLEFEVNSAHQAVISKAAAKPRGRFQRTRERVRD